MNPAPLLPHRAESEALKLKWIMREGNPMTSPYPLILKSKSLATLLAVLVNTNPEILK